MWCTRAPNALFSARAERGSQQPIEYSAVTFHEDLDPIPAEVLKVARSYPSPLVLFENPSMNYDPACFDLITPALTPPGLWLRSIQDSINYSRELRARSQALRQETAAVRAEVCARLSRMLLLLPVSVDLDEVWRIDSNTD